MAKVKRKKRTRYSSEKKAEILAVAKKEGLTAAAVQKRFGVTPVTYYSWRKKAGVGKRRRSRVAVRAGRDGSLESQLRSEVRAKIQELLPSILREEVGEYFNAAGSGRRRR